MGNPTATRQAVGTPESRQGLNAPNDIFVWAETISERVLP